MARVRRSVQGGAAGAAAPGGPAGSAALGGNPLAFLRTASPGQFTEEDRANAKLPPPPEEDSQLEVLLRPGLLADVEITVERIPNAMHMPAQAVFEKDGQPIVYVQSGSRFQERSVKLARRSESTMVIADGVKPDEIVALADPYARQKAKKGEKKKGGNAMGGMPRRRREGNRMRDAIRHYCPN